MAFNLTNYNRQMLLKLVVISSAMFAFGYALIPMYKVLCEVTGINVVTSKNDYGTRAVKAVSKNTQVDESRLITVEFDSNTQGPFRFRAVKNSMQHKVEQYQRKRFQVMRQNKQHSTLRSWNVFALSSKR
jgi:cytochrome c oxidase assembly protein subunit 11